MQFLKVYHSPQRRKLGRTYGLSWLMLRKRIVTRSLSKKRRSDRQPLKKLSMQRPRYTLQRTLLIASNMYSTSNRKRGIKNSRVSPRWRNWPTSRSFKYSGAFDTRSYPKTSYCNWAQTQISPSAKRWSSRVSQSNLLAQSSSTQKTSKLSWSLDTLSKWALTHRWMIILAKSLQ